MGYKVGIKDADRIFGQLQDEYEIWAPKRFVGKGRYSDTDLIRYARVDSVEEIEYREKSDFPAKEVLSPITQSLFYFTEDEFIESRVSSKKLLIFMRPCDIHAQHHQEKIYLTNGGFEDMYYKRMKEREDRYDGMLRGLGYLLLRQHGHQPVRGLFPGSPFW